LTCEAYGDKYLDFLINDQTNLIIFSNKSKQYFEEKNVLYTAYESHTAYKTHCIFIPFLSTFSDNPPESYEDQQKQRIFKKDDLLFEKIKDNKSKFLYYIIHMYKLYKNMDINDI